MVAAVHATVDSDRRGSATRRWVARTAIAAGVLIAGTGSAAAAGALPDAAQSAIARATSHIGLVLPDPNATVHPAPTHPHATSTSEPTPTSTTATTHTFDHGDDSPGDHGRNDHADHGADGGARGRRPRDIRVGGAPPVPDSTGRPRRACAPRGMPTVEAASRNHTARHSPTSTPRPPQPANRWPTSVHPCWPRHRRQPTEPPSVDTPPATSARPAHGKPSTTSATSPETRPAVTHAATPDTSHAPHSPGEGRRHHTLIQGSVRERCVRGASPRLRGPRLTGGVVDGGGRDCGRGLPSRRRPSPGSIDGGVEPNVQAFPDGRDGRIVEPAVVDRCDVGAQVIEAGH